VLGGYLVEYQSWHWIFFINIPLASPAWRQPHRSSAKLSSQTRPADVPGFLLSASGLACVLYALAEAGPAALMTPGSHSSALLA